MRGPTCGGCGELVDCAVVTIVKGRRKGERKGGTWRSLGVARTEVRNALGRRAKAQKADVILKGDNVIEGRTGRV